MDFTLRQLQYFDAVASAGSLSAAAAQTHVTPSALTLAIDELERHLGVQLLIRRKGRGVALTAVGSQLLARARAILASAEGLADEASATGSSLIGRFAVGCFTTLAPFVVPGFAESFRHAHPGLTLELSTGTAAEIQESLLQGRIDAGVLYSLDVPASLTFEAVREHRPYVLVAADHRLAARTSVSLHELTDDTLIALDVPPTHRNTENMLAALGIAPRIGRTSASFEAVRCMVGFGQGYAILFQRPATSQTYDGHEVRTLEIEDAVAPAVVGLCRAAGAPITSRYRALRSLLAGEDVA
ncbi:LysR substrate-binding domain-containing protein [Microbacterium sp. SORGH_AS_0888]|uniref:LysR substrate-binding domain-containing protein n=1 Tax=Microbacterium sp. SORGH_AS_0888 TaxID=3041791 RepID=UPI00278305B9|nr:LysR substrate-binding domain-containing protein [Microbacterium sp. SORGH_AS_0888]MDQ1129811.1 DNA-binding transcriptional LysR family regulator [Microbacterium sp. SORGH_AS_0888]